MSRLPVILEPHSSYSTCRYGKMYIIALCTLELSYSQQCTLCCKLWMENRKGHLKNLHNIYVTSCLLLLPCIVFSLFIPLSHSSFNTLANLGTNSSLCRKHQLNIYILVWAHAVPPVTPCAPGQPRTICTTCCCRLATVWKFGMAITHAITIWPLQIVS